MRINLISDLHLEFSTNVKLPGGDVLVMAGDICEVKNLKQAKYQDWFFNECAKYQEVIYVLGNHEHYGNRLQKSYAMASEYMPENVTILEDQTKEIEGVLFVGSTLWTDMNDRDRSTMSMCDQFMNDHRYVTVYNEKKNAYHRLTAECTVDIHDRSLAYIKHVVENDNGLPIVVVTHHAPSFSSVGEKFKHETLMNGGFVSNLDAFIESHPQIRYWLHGHVHNFNDYTVGSTRIISNPRGYDGYEHRAFDFDPGFGFDI